MNDLLLNKPEKNNMSRKKAVVLYCLVSFFLFFEMAVQVSPSVMSSQLMHDLSIGTFGLGLMSGLYFYTYTAMQLPSGMLFDRYNPRIIIVLSILTCSVGTFLFGIAKDIYLGSFARLLMGSGSAFAFVSVLVVTADIFKSKHFAAITGVTQMLAALGAMAGQLPISILLMQVGWRHTLFILCAIGLILAIIIWKLLTYPRHPFHKKSKNNLLNLKKITTDSQTWYIAIYACLLWAPMSSFASLWGVPFLMKADHLEQNQAAFLCSLMWLGLAVASPLLGIISTTYKNRVMPLTISAMVGTIAFGLLLEFNFSSFNIGLLLFFAGAACAGQALSFTVIKENNDIAVKGTAIAFNNMAVVISGAIFQPIIGKLLEFKQINSLNNVADFKNALLIVLFAYFIAFLVALLLIKEPKEKLFNFKFKNSVFES